MKTLGPPYPQGPNIGALIIRVGFGVYHAIVIIRNAQNPILTIKAPKALRRERLSLAGRERGCRDGSRFHKHGITA